MAIVADYLRMHLEMRKAMLARHPLSTAPEGYKYNSMEQLVLVEGRQFTSEEPEAEERAAILKDLEMALSINPDYGRGQQCYLNAYLMAVSNRNYQYVEGYACHTIPTLHAWLLYKGRILVDPTYRTEEGWRLERRSSMSTSIIGSLKGNMDYIGLVFQTRVVRRLGDKWNRAGGFIDNWQNNWPLLKTGMPLK